MFIDVYEKVGFIVGPNLFILKSGYDLAKNYAHYVATDIFICKYVATNILIYC